MAKWGDMLFFTVWHFTRHSCTSSQTIDCDHLKCYTLYSKQFCKMPRMPFIYKTYLLPIWNIYKNKMAAKCHDLALRSRGQWRVIWFLQRFMSSCHCFEAEQLIFYVSWIVTASLFYSNMWVEIYKECHLDVHYLMQWEELLLRPVMKHLPSTASRILLTVHPAKFEGVLVYSPSLFDENCCPCKASL